MKTSFDSISSFNFCSFIKVKQNLFGTVFFILLQLFALAPGHLMAQAVTVLNIDTKGLMQDPVAMGNMVRIELDKLHLFEVTDKYDVYQLIDKSKLENCYGKTCLIEVGKTLKSEKMLSGSIEKMGESIFVNFRLVNVNSGAVEKSFIKEFLNYPNELQRIVRISLREMFDLGNDETIVQSLTQKEAFANTFNEPHVSRLKLDGPRMGLTIFTGNTAEIIKASAETGGFDRLPLMFQFGYQFETQYLNEGNFQSLLEFIPMITGLDQGIVLPSVTILNGLRSNKSGWEFAFGPTVSLVSVSEGYYHNGVWRQAHNDMPQGQTLVKRMDSRGNIELRSAFVLAFGKSFRSGKLNIPVNGYIIPSKDGARIGASFGFNAKNK